MRPRPLLFLAVLLAGGFALKSLSIVDSAFLLFEAQAHAAPKPQKDESKEEKKKENDKKKDDHIEEGHGEEEKEDTPPPTRPAMLDQSRFDRAGSGGSLTASQLALETNLAKRRRQLAERERTLDTREQLLAVAETKYDERLSRLTEIRDEVQGLLGQLDTQRQHQINAIVSTIAALEPQAAADILTQMRQSDPETLLMATESLNSDENRRKFSQILAALDPAMGAWLLSELRLRAEPDQSVIESEARNVASLDK